MVEKRRGLPVGLLIAAPPLLAGLYFASLWLPYKLAGWVPPNVLVQPIVWFADTVLAPLLDMVGWAPYPYHVDGWAFAGIFCAAWSAAFLPVGLLLGGLAALVNLLWSSGGRGDREA